MAMCKRSTRGDVRRGDISLEVTFAGTMKIGIDVDLQEFGEYKLGRIARSDYVAQYVLAIDRRLRAHDIALDKMCPHGSTSSYQTNLVLSGAPYFNVIVHQDCICGQLSVAYHVGSFNDSAHT
jgi:hypothetical protein